MYSRSGCPVTAMWITSFVLPLMAWATAVGQTPTEPAMRQGEITGNDVYVRSGPTLNHYTVCKLNAGTRVTVVGEEGEWYEIRPPEGTFSLISGDYVDTANDRTGVVNGNNVRVRTGSLLNENKYTVQTLLGKGAEVTILGRNPDGFLRIEPPPGATLWINRQFVELVPEGASAAQRESETGSAAPTTPADATAPGTPAAGEVRHGGAEGAAQGSELSAVEVTDERRQLQNLDTLVAAELAKPTVERRFDALIKRYQTVAGQKKDEFARKYAEARVAQLTDMATLVGTIRKMRQLDDQAESRRRLYLEGRAKIREATVPGPAALDAQGELRTSVLYPKGSYPHRYRLVDTSGVQERTIGYVEIPKGSPIDADSLVGRYVGVRASAKRLQSGGVNPVPIYVASELVLLQPTPPAAEATKPD